MSRITALAALALFLGGCAQTVRPLGLHDHRLPPDARRWIADAEDAVVVAQAGRDETSAELNAVLAWRAEVAAIPWPEGAGSVSAAQALDAMAAARVEVARLGLARAEAELALAEAKLVQVNAETAIRHDLAVYDLEPVRARTEAARARVEAGVRALETARRGLDEATTAWWTAFQAYVSGGGQGAVLWVSP